MVGRITRIQEVANIERDNTYQSNRKTFEENIWQKYLGPFFRCSISSSCHFSDVWLKALLMVPV